MYAHNCDKKISNLTYIRVYTLVTNKFDYFGLNQSKPIIPPYLLLFTSREVITFSILINNNILNKIISNKNYL